MMTDDEYRQIGKRVRSEHNPLIGSFAAELINESYPLPKDMCTVLFDRFSDKQLGKKFTKWVGEEWPL